MANTPTSTLKSLQKEYKDLQKETVEGCCVWVADEANMLEWNVGIFGPPETIFQGAYFKALVTFPHDYPFSPPFIKFVSDIWHPNVYPNGTVCISILHPPTDDEVSGELPSERWNPTRTLRSVLLSVASMLNTPNISSPANVDAAVMYRNWVKNNDPAYLDRIKDLIEKNKGLADIDGVKIPQNQEEYCKKHNPQEEDYLQDSLEFDLSLYSDDYDSDAECYSDDDEIE